MEPSVVEGLPIPCPRNCRWNSPAGSNGNISGSLRADCPEKKSKAIVNQFAGPMKILNVRIHWDFDWLRGKLPHPHEYKITWLIDQTLLSFLAAKVIFRGINRSNWSSLRSLTAMRMTELSLRDNFTSMSSLLTRFSIYALHSPYLYLEESRYYWRPFPDLLWVTAGHLFNKRLRPSSASP